MLTSLKTTFSQKIGLFLFGLLIMLVVLELVLRLGGWLFLTLQEGANRPSVRAEKEYRIICLGESTTALGGENSYPRQLEKILNSRQNKVVFKVINKGVPATTTDQILSRVENYFTQYQPHMVIAMMGINDPLNQAQWTWRDKTARHSKAFKLFDMIVRHWSAKKQEILPHYVEKKIIKLEEQALKKPTLRVAVELAKANLYRSANRPQQEKEAILKVIALEAENSQAWFLLGIHFDRQAEHQKALEAYLKALVGSSIENKTKIIERIAQCHIFLGNEQSALESYLNIVKQMPQHPEANSAVADLLMGQDKFAQAIPYYLQQLKVDPLKADVYGKLARCFRSVGQADTAFKFLEEGQRVGGNDAELFYQWAYALLEEKKFALAQTAFEKALNANSDDKRGLNEKILEGLLKCYQAQNLTDKIVQTKKLLQKQKTQYNFGTKENYLKLSKLCVQKQTKLVAVQYPHRPLAPLEQMLSSSSGIIFVDNQKVFADALQKYSYDEIFSDRFAGDFGHCTVKGNAVLAENIATKILAILAP